MKQLFTILVLTFAMFTFGQINCTADFTYTVDSNTNTVTFESYGFSYDSTAATNYAWTIDGQSLTGQDVSYTYTNLPFLACVTIEYAGGCSVQSCDTVMVTTTDPCAGFAVNVNYDEVMPATCDGELMATVYGGAAPYSYSWDNGATSQTITGLCEGSYNLTVIDANGCSTNGFGYVYADTSGGQVIDSLYNTAIDTCIDFTVTNAYVSNIILIDSNTVEVEWTFVGSGVTQIITETYTFGGTYGSYNISISIDCNPSKAVQTWGDVILVNENTPANIKEIETINNLKVYPNPVKDVLNIDFTTTDNNPINVQIVNYTGQIVSSISVNTYAGNNSLSINTSDLNSGVYFVRINSKTIKFIK